MVRQQKPLTYKVYEKLYDNIVNGIITSNDILTEGQLVEMFQVSKSPVREALISLCEEDVLQSIPRVGYRVLQISPVQVNALTEARFALEPFMLEKAWPHIGDMQIDQLKCHLQASKAEESLKTSIQENWRRNIQFHLMVASYAHNEYLQGMLERTLRSCARAATQYFLNVRGIPRGEEDMHNMILQAIQDKDLEKALSTLKADIHEII